MATLKALAAATVCVLALMAAGCYLRHSLRIAAANRKREKRQRKREQNLERMRKQIQGKNINLTICELPFRVLHERLQKGDLVPSEVLLAFQAQALIAQDKLNCVVDFIESAQRLAEALDQVPAAERGPLHGIPVSLKESAGVKGSDWTLGLVHYVDDVCTEDAVLVQLLIKQGAVPFVRTNLSQGMMSLHCRNPIFGETLNPVQPSRSCGGSSGGDGALIGAGASVLSIGCDMGGSNRVPAHFCGIVGVKVTPSRLTATGNHPLGRNIKALSEVYSPLGRDVESVVTYLRATLGPQLYQLDPLVPHIPWREELYSSSEHLTIGFYTHDGGLEPVPAVTRAVKLAKQRLETLGHKVVQFQPPDVPDVIASLFMSVLLAFGYNDAGKIVKNDQLDPGVKMLFSLTKLPLWVRNLMSMVPSIHPCQKLIIKTKIPADISEWWEITGEKERYIYKFIKLWKSQGLDALICPAFGMTAFPIGEDEHCNAGGSYTALYNILDFPCGVVPATTVQREDLEAMVNYPKKYSAELYVHKISEGSLGLPVGVQCVSLPFQEEVLMRLMSDLETVLGKHLENGST